MARSRRRAALEYHGATERAALDAIEEKIRRNTQELLAPARAEAIPPRRGAHS